MTEFSASITRACILQTISNTYARTYVRRTYASSTMSWHSGAKTKYVTRSITCSWYPCFQSLYLWDLSCVCRCLADSSPPFALSLSPFLCFTSFCGLVSFYGLVSFMDTKSSTAHKPSLFGKSQFIMTKLFRKMLWRVT